MELEEAKKNIDILSSRLNRTSSRKLRSFITADILTLENFIRTEEPTFEYNVSPFNFNYQDYKERLLKEKEIRCNEVFDANELNYMLATHISSEFESTNFTPFLTEEFKIENQKRMVEAFRDFMGSLGEVVYRKYNKLIKDGDLMKQYMSDNGGICWNFQTFNRQVVVCDEGNGQYDYMALAHEIGHSLHFDLLNQKGFNKIEHNTFVESLSILFEELFMNYMEQNGIDIGNLRKFTYSQRLGDALAIEIASLATKNGYALFDGYGLVFDDFKLEDLSLENRKYSYLMEKLIKNLEYVNHLYYLLGYAVTEKTINEYKDSSEAIKFVLDFLLRSEYHTHKENMEYLGLPTYEFKSLNLKVKKYSDKY